MIDEIINKGEGRFNPLRPNARLEQYAVTLPLEIRNEIDRVDIHKFITNGVLDFVLEFDDQPYKEKIWVWIHALESFITIEGFINTDDEDEARALAEHFGYDCYFDLIKDESIYI
jgi:hypothetical protein